MSLQYDWPGTIPAETVRVAQAAFPKGAVAMGMRDLLGGFVTDHDLDRVYLLCCGGGRSRRPGGWRW